MLPASSHMKQFDRRSLNRLRNLFFNLKSITNLMEINQRLSGWYLKYQEL